MRVATDRGRLRFRRLRWAVPIAAVALLSFGANARAETVTVGSPLTPPFAPVEEFGAVLTVANTALPEAGAHVTSPISGTIVRWRVLLAEGGPFKLHLLRPAGGSSFTDVGTSSPETPSGTGLETFATNLPIQVGDTIGLDNNAAADKIGRKAEPGAQYSFWIPFLHDGATLPPSATLENLEIAFNADVQSPPSDSSTPVAATTAPVVCLVPKLKGRRLRPAKRVLRKRHCRIGKVIRKHRKKAPRKARVIKQRPRPRTVRPAGSKVNVTLRVRKKAQRKKAR